MLQGSWSTLRRLHLRDVGVGVEGYRALAAAAQAGRLPELRELGVTCRDTEEDVVMIRKEDMEALTETTWARLERLILGNDEFRCRDMPAHYVLLHRMRTRFPALGHDVGWVHDVLAEYTELAALCNDLRG